MIVHPVTDLEDANTVEAPEKMNTPKMAVVEFVVVLANAQVVTGAVDGRYNKKTICNII
ncbi:hypothetical protein [Bacteroides acidifaciens]|uniref:hypothetical protein n=1 Tax=Bacteroides acidifaciens TaxID=85831 RepID=UPI00261E399E|nr:hypothetical protein [Bacteroides acidifaciens]